MQEMIVCPEIGTVFLTGLLITTELYWRKTNSSFINDPHKEGKVMLINELKKRDVFYENKKVNKYYINYEKVLQKLEKLDLPEEIIEAVNSDIDDLNTTYLTDRELIKLFKQKTNNLTKLLFKEIQIWISEWEE